MKLKLNLRTKLILSSLLILTPVVVLLVQNYRAAYDNQRDQVYLDQKRLAQSVSVMLVDGSFDQSIAIDQSYAQDPVIHSVDPARISNYLAGIAPLYPEYDDALAVFDAQGEQVASASGFGPLNVADREWFKAVMRTGEPVVANLVLSRGSGNPIIPIAVPIKDEDGNVVGAVSSALSPNQIVKQLSSVQIAPEQHIFLADRSGRLAFHTAQPDQTWGERDASDFPPILTALEGHSFGGDVSHGIFGKNQIIVTVPTPKYGWVVGVETPVDVAFSPMQDSIRTTLIVSVVVLVFTLGLIWGLAELMSHPLKRLTKSAVALGKGEVQQQAEVKTGDEFEEIATAFNEMAEEIRVRANEITRSYETEQATRAEAEVARQQVTDILENITNGFFALDLQWHFAYVNGEAEQLLRRRRGELIGRCIWEIFPETVGSTFYREYHRAVSRQVAVGFEALYPPNTWVEVHAYPSKDGLSVYFQDITSRKRAEAERERLAKILDVTPDFVGIADVDGHVLYLNRAARAMMGIGENEDVSSRKVDANHPAWTTDIILNEAFPMAVCHGSWRGETAVLGRCGEEIPVSMVILAHKSPSGKVEFFSTISRIIGERRRAGFD